MILLDSVTKTYAGDKKPAIDDVSLHIEPNEFVFLVGVSGAGKSSLIKMITKEEVPDRGKIVVGGIDLDYVKKRHIPGYRRRLGVVFQDFKLLPRRTVYENVAFALEIAGMSGKEIRKTVPKVLELVDLLDQAKKFPDQLSGGQQQRVSIARSVARQPKILIADEPTANLDKLTTEEIIGLLKKINDFGTTVLVSTHDEAVVNNLHKRVITMRDGKIIDDQKNGGIYKLDEAKKPEVAMPPQRIIRVPGYAASTEDAARVVMSTKAENEVPKATPLQTAVKVPVADKISAASAVPASRATVQQAKGEVQKLATQKTVMRKPAGVAQKQVEQKLATPKTVKRARPLVVDSGILNVRQAKIAEPRAIPSRHATKRRVL